VAYQTALLRRARQQFVNGSLPSVALADFPQVRALFDTATVAAIKELRAARMGPSAPNSTLDLTSQPCGDFVSPRPAFNPPKQLQGPYKDIPGTLQRAGYHPTTGYACGRSSEKICRGDYTRGTRYVSRVGVCSAPRFRDQAAVSGTLRGYVWVQYGEPNPEYAGYGWPYWDWAAYVVWWHRNY
jgi:hypothetical protein